LVTGLTSNPKADDKHFRYDSKMNVCRNFRINWLNYSQKLADKMWTYTVDKNMKLVMMHKSVHVNILSIYIGIKNIVGLLERKMVYYNEGREGVISG